MTAGQTTLVPVVGEVDGVAVGEIVGVAEFVALGVALVDAVGIGVAAGSAASAAFAVAAIKPVVARVKAMAVIAAKVRLFIFLLFIFMWLIT